MSDAPADGEPAAALCPYFEHAGIAPADQAGELMPLLALRCCSQAEPVAVSPQHQAVFCLTERHPACSRYCRPVAPRPASVQSRRHYTLSAAAVLLAIGAATALSVVVVGNPLSVEPDNPASPTPAVAFGASPSPAPTDASGIDERPTPMPAATTPTAAIAVSPAATPRPATASVTPAGTVTPVSSAITAASYTVQPGDTLIGLARRFDLTVPVLAAANGLGTADGLRIGQILRIPAVASPRPMADPR